MKTIGPQKEWLGTYRFNPRCVFPDHRYREDTAGIKTIGPQPLFLGTYRLHGWWT